VRKSISMSALWVVSVQGRAYGPYTDAEIKAFANEGRLAPQSLVARAGETRFRTASEEPALAALFAPKAISPALQINPVSALEIVSPVPDQDDLARTTKRATEPMQPAFGRQDDSTRPGERAHIIIIADMKSRSIDGLEEEICKLGPTVTFLPQAWLVSSELSVNAIRNTLVQQLGKLDMLFVIDATRDKAAWFNFGPEIDARVRRNWARTTEANLKQNSAA
jgi:hypothetical protein